MSELLTLTALSILVAGFLVGVVVGLTGMGGGALMTPALIFLGQLAGGDHDDRDIAAALALTQRVHEFEPVHLRHHQVQEDQRRPGLGDAFERHPPVLRQGHSPTLAFEVALQQFPDRGIVLDHQHPSRS